MWKLVILKNNDNFPEKYSWCIPRRLFGNRHQVESFHFIQCTSLWIHIFQCFKEVAKYFTKFLWSSKVQYCIVSAKTSHNLTLNILVVVKYALLKWQCRCIFGVNLSSPYKFSKDKQNCWRRVSATVTSPFEIIRRDKYWHANTNFLKHSISGTGTVL